MSKSGDKRRASEMARFVDAHQEYKETKSEDARRRRHEAMFDSSPENARRCMDMILTETANEATARKDRARKLGIKFKRS